MLSIGAMGGGQYAYYSTLAREDYYLHGGEPPGRWWGSGAQALALAGVVDAEQLGQVFAGFSVSGTPLVQNAGGAKRQPGWDLTFSAPKSVSVLWSQAEPDVRARIQEAQAVAVETALRYLQENASFSRRGSGGGSREKAGLVVATFEHGTSRALDPQLHTHCLVMNLGVRADGSTGTVLSKPFYDNKMLVGALYRAQLAFELTQRLQVEIEKKGTAFEVKGVPQSLISEFSKRRAAIEKDLAASGLETASAAAFATLKTRDVKANLPSRQALFETWRETGMAHGFRAPTTVDTSSRLIIPTDAPGPTFTEALHRALSSLTESQSHFTEREVARQMLEDAPTRGLDAASVCEPLHVELLNSREVVVLGDQGGTTHYTTKDMFKVEEQLLDAVARLAAKREHHVAPARDLEKTLLTPEQAAALRYLTNREHGNVRLLEGLAGTGKTRLLGALREAYEREGYTVLGATLSAKAASELGRGAGIPSMTLKRLEFFMSRRPLGQRVKHHARQLGRAARGKRTYPLKPLVIDKKTVLILDEAGMIGTRDLQGIVDKVERGGGLLVLSGDRRQLQAITAGGPFAALGDRFGHASLTETIRQRRERDRETVGLAAQGEASAVLQRLAEDGHLVMAPSPERAKEDLVEDWAVREAGRRNQNVIFAGKRSDVLDLNHRCQARRLDLGETSRRRGITVGETRVFEGDRVLFTKNCRPLGLTNGELGTLTSINKLTRSVSVQTDTGETRHVPLRHYTDLSLGYAVTTHKGQGSTVERAYILLGGFMQDRELSYVQVSRARGETWAYANTKESGKELLGLVERMSLSRAKDLAHDVVHTRERHPEATR